MIDLNRRSFLRASLWVAAAPMIVKASSLMKVRAIEEPFQFSGFYSNVSPLGPIEFGGYVWWAEAGTSVVHFRPLERKQ